MKILAALLVCGAAHSATLRYWVEPCSKPESACHNGDPELARWAMEAWQAASGGALTLRQTPDRDKAHIRVHWASGSAGLFGETRPILVDGVRGSEVYVLPAVVPPDETDALLRDAIVYLTCLHETGHALGLPHTDAFADYHVQLSVRRRHPRIFRALPPAAFLARGHPQTLRDVGPKSPAAGGVVPLTSHKPERTGILEL